MDFTKEFEEMKSYTVEDLKLLIETQQDLYSEDEMKQIKSLLDEKINGQKKEKTVKIPEMIRCPKCDGPNEYESDVCAFCGCKIDKNQELEEYYEDDDDDDDDDSSGGRRGHGFYYVISLLIPIVGFIMGAVMAASDDEDKSSAGKGCIACGIISCVLELLLYFFVFKSMLS